jgi:hypothetical protein
MGAFYFELAVPRPAETIIDATESLFACGVIKTG